MSIENQEPNIKNGLLKLSVSKTNTFLQCKSKFKFSYILKLPKKEYSYHTLGRFAHRVLELFHLAYINGSKKAFPAVMSESFNEALKEMKDKISLSQKDEVFSICSKYLDLVKLDPKIISRVKSVEKVFNINLNENLILTGMIDRVQLDDDGIYHIADYKTSKSKTYLQEDLLQLLTYAYVIYLENPEIEKVRVSYIMLKFGCEFITKEFNLKEILSIKNIYEKHAEEINNETEYAPSITKLCAYCDFAADACGPGKQYINNLYKIGKTKW